MIKFIVFTLLLFSSIGLFGEEPWGKDAELNQCKPASISSPNSCSTPFIGPLGEILIGFHQNIISPADGPRSHFIPSSSQYTLDGMRKYGFFQGFFLGCDRLMRENSDPWIYRTVKHPLGHSMKYDPIP